MYREAYGRLLLSALNLRVQGLTSASAKPGNNLSHSTLVIALELTRFYTYSINRITQLHTKNSYTVNVVKQKKLRDNSRKESRDNSKKESRDNSKKESRDKLAATKDYCKLSAYLGVFNYYELVPTHYKTSLYERKNH